MRSVRRCLFGAPFLGVPNRPASRDFEHERVFRQRREPQRLLRSSSRLTASEQRFVEAADLKREELGRRLGHGLGEDLPNKIAHALERKAFARGDLDDRNPAIKKANDPRLAGDLP